VKWFRGQRVTLLYGGSPHAETSAQDQFLSAEFTLIQPREGGTNFVHEDRMRTARIFFAQNFYFLCG